MALAAVLTLLVAAIVMFALGRPRTDVVGLIMIITLPLVGVLTQSEVVSMSEALMGFSDPNIILIAALFVMGEGLVRTGVAGQMGDWVTAKAGNSETKLIVLLMVVVCLLGSTMSSTAVTAIFIPVVLRIARKTRIAPSRLMMPLSTAALISGMMTLVATTPNLIVNSELVRRGEVGLGFFSFTPFGLVILSIGLAYMLVARRWLPVSDGTVQRGGPARMSLVDWVQRYRLAEHAHRMRVTGRSSLVGLTLDQFDLRKNFGANIVAIQRDHQLIQPTTKTQVHGGDILLVDLFSANICLDRLLQEYSLEELPLSGVFFTDQSQDLGMVEVIVPADSELVGKTVVDSGFRARFGLTAIGLRRGPGSIKHDLKGEVLRVGDTLLVIGPWKAIRNLQNSRQDLVVLELPLEHDDVLPASSKAMHALTILGLVVAFMVSRLIPNVQAALFGCLLMGATGCIDLKSAYRSIDWKTLILIVGMLPFSLALERTGGVEWASNMLKGEMAILGTYGVLATLFVMTAVLGMFISNTATAILMAPIAMGTADQLNASPYPFAMIVALAASAAFMTPVSSPVNTLVVTPGNYRFSDFVRVGVPMALICLVISVLMVPWLLPL